MAVGICLSAFYLFPALTTLRDISPGKWVFEGACSINRSFLLPLFTYSSGLCWKSLQIGFPIAALLALILAAWSLRRSNSAGKTCTNVGLLVGIGAAALFFGSELSYPLWRYESPLQKLQFPDRFNTILLAAALLALALASLEVWRKEHRSSVKYLVSAALSCSMVFSMALVLNLLRLPAVPTISDRLDVASDFGLPEYVSAVAKPSYRSFLRNGSFQAECRREGIVCQTLRRSSKDFKFLIRLDQPASVDLPVFAYPAWAVFLDGSRQATELDQSTGLVRVVLLPGVHHVELRWRLGIQQWIGIAISLVALIVILLSRVLFRLSDSTDLQTATNSAEFGDVVQLQEELEYDRTLFSR